MIGYIIVCILTIISGVLQIVFRDDDDTISWGGFGSALFSITGMFFAVSCTRTDFPSLWPYTLVICVLIIITSLTNLVGKVGLCFSFFPILITALSPEYDVKDLGDNHYIVCGKHSYWITGKTHAVGKDLLKINVIVSRGRYENTPHEKDIMILHDADDYIYIPTLCCYDDGYKNYEIQFFKDQETSVNVIKLIKEDGSYVLRDFYGKDVESPGYCPPDYDDDPTPIYYD